MKQFFIFLAAVVLTATTFAQVGIGTTTPDASSALDITSTTKGFLMPRMTAAQRDAISAPAQGLIIFCTNCASNEGELQVKHTSSWKNIIGGDVNDPPPEVGEFYGGGVVFHLFIEGESGYVSGETHGLIAAVEDQSSGIRWYNGSYSVTGATGTAVGTGSTNTDTIITEQGATATSYAAGLARAYTGGGYTDWFLPSKDELNKMYLKKTDINTTALANSGSNFSNNYYWSSTESGSGGAWCQFFFNGNQANVGKDITVIVRAVRAF
ncbi:MAG: DUF1566 domain-containing protein [Bacteroidetes bacterium]|nr:DUF1566 domain-containing protein [Bacteroidota bacterium]